MYFYMYMHLRIYTLAHICIFSNVPLRQGMAHTLLLNAMAMKLQRSHYEESWKVSESGKNGGLNHENP